MILPGSGPDAGPQAAPTAARAATAARRLRAVVRVRLPRFPAGLVIIFSMAVVALPVMDADTEFIRYGSR
jgi:hypothetical protein